jgi:hypothetical protein
MHWLQYHMLPCASKMLFGIDCPICGFQRAFILLLQGKFTESFSMYPPLLPCLLFMVILAIYVIRRQAIKPHLLRISSYALLCIIFGSYFIKMAMIVLPHVTLLWG